MPPRRHRRMPERPAPLVLVATPATDQPFGSHAAVAAEGQRLLAAELSHRLGRLGAAVAPLPFEAPPDGGSFHWGRWFAAAARRALAATGDRGRDRLRRRRRPGAARRRGPRRPALPDPRRGGRQQPLQRRRVRRRRRPAIGRSPRSRDCESDNGAPRALNDAGWEWRDLGADALGAVRRRHHARPRAPAAGDAPGWDPRGRRLGARLPRDGAAAGRPAARGARTWIAIGAVIRDRSAELVVAGRVPTTTWQMLETETACRVRGLRRGARHALVRRGAGAAARSWRR